MTSVVPPTLSKSRFTVGLQCHKRLWLEVHEREASELVTDDAQQAIFDRGHLVGELAREEFAGGVLIDRPYYEITERVRDTRAALEARIPAIYEASFFEDGVFVAVDVLERRRRGYNLVEVKSTTKVKEQHLPDVAVQLYVLRKAGVHVPRAELMHLNRQCRAPDLDDLFTRADITEEVEALQPELPKQIKSLRRMLARPMPDVETGAHCSSPYTCPFSERCNPALPEHHVSTLHGMRAKKLESLLEEGYETIHDLPDDYASEGVVSRQVEAVKRNRIVVDPALAAVLASVGDNVAFLDFETIAPPIPFWTGTRPYDAVPVQFSCHVQHGGRMRHHAWLAEGGRDPRAEIARELVSACAGATTVLVYHASFERQRINELIEAVPALARELAGLAARLDDMLPWVRDHVYHPSFAGSFSLKVVGPVLSGHDGYAGLEIQDGQSASDALQRLLLGTERLDVAEQLRLRTALLAYCEQDTLVMVRLLKRLRELASVATSEASPRARSAAVTRTKRASRGTR